MPFRYKIDVLSALKNAGFSTYRIQKEKILSCAAVQQLRDGDMVSIRSLEKICEMLDCDIGDVVTRKDD